MSAATLKSALPMLARLRLLPEPLPLLLLLLLLLVLLEVMPWIHLASNARCSIGAGHEHSWRDASLA